MTNAFGSLDALCRIPRTHQSSTAKAPRQPNKLAGEGGWTFRAPRGGDLVVCPYCNADTITRCDYCGDEGHIFADEFFDGH